MRLRLRPLQKKYLSCLRCGKTMWTDAAHRLCRKCRRHNSEVYDAPVFNCSGDSQDLASL
jgi:Zn finger protein HypA/HybF involved in hydrogenase expression